MLLSSLVSLVALVSAQAAPILAPGSGYKIDSSLKDSAPAYKGLAYGLFENKMKVRGAEPPFAPIHSYYQRIHFKRVEKAGELDRFELLFSRLKVSGRREGKADFSEYLSNKPLVAIDGGVTNEFGQKNPGLYRESPNRELLLKANPRGGSKKTFLIFLNDAGLSDEVSFISRKWICLAGLEGKPIGARWKSPLGPKLNYDCEFAGWAMVKGKKVAVVKIDITAVNTIWTGTETPSKMNFHRSGVIYLEPETQEVLQEQQMDFTVDPPLTERHLKTSSMAHSFAEPLPRLLAPAENK